MSWEDRLKEAAYTSPSGNRFVFEYENVSQEVEKKTTAFTFPNKDGAFIQDLGRAGRTFPFTVFFSGADYDTIADNFLLALEEKGAGKLEHPRYGDRIVVPTGSISIREDLATGANQAAFSVTFSETIENITFPSSSKSTTDALSNSASEFQTSAADQFASDIQLDNASEAIALQNTAANSVAVIGSLEEITKQDSNINASFKTIKAAYEEQVKNVATEAGDTALQAILLTRTPARIVTDIKNEIAIYTTMIDGIITAGIANPDGTTNPRNTYLYKNLLASAGLIALSEVPLFSIINTRPEAVSAANSIQDLFDDLKEWQDGNIESLDIISPHEAYYNLLVTITQAVIYLINLSFELPQERIVTLQNDRNLIEFLASVGLDVETNIDNFIQWNNLTGDEIEILPRGMVVTYYV